MHILYVEDVARAMMQFYESSASGLYNLGGGEQSLTSLLECVELLANLTGKNPEVKFGEARQGDLNYFCCDNSKAQAEFGWSPEIRPREGVAKLLEWIDSQRDCFIS